MKSYFYMNIATRIALTLEQDRDRTNVVGWVFWPLSSRLYLRNKGHHYDNDYRDG